MSAERIGFVIKIPRARLEQLAGVEIEVLVRRWEDGSVTADTRTAERGVWLPVSLDGGTATEVQV